MMCIVTLKEIHDFVEEEVTVFVNNVYLTCFCSSGVAHQDIGGAYNAVLELVILDDLAIERVSNYECAFQRIDDTFEYKVTGFLDVHNQKLLASGFEFELDGFYLGDYSFLHGQLVCIIADRISIEFLGAAESPV